MARRDEQRQSPTAERAPVAATVTNRYPGAPAIYLVVGPGSIGAEGRFYGPGEMVMLSADDANRDDIRGSVTLVE